MKEVTKLYENTGIDRIEDGYCLPGYCKRHPSKRFENCETCKQCEYGHFYMSPEFIEHKQLELIKWLAETRPIHINLLLDKWTIEGMVRYGIKYDTFEDALSGYINQIWQDLTDAERTQIKEILSE